MIYVCRTHEFICTRERLSFYVLFTVDKVHLGEIASCFVKNVNIFLYIHSESFAYSKCRVDMDFYREFDEVLRQPLN